jgi:Fe-S cluster assembly iron-binding protein IscA
MTMEINFTLSEKARETILNMMEYIKTTHNKESLPAIHMREVPGTDTVQCAVEFYYKGTSTGMMPVEVSGVPIVIDDSDAAMLSGMVLDYDDGQFITVEREEHSPS